MPDKPLIDEQLQQWIIANSSRQHPLEEQLRAESQQLSNSRMVCFPEGTQFLTFILKLMQAKRVIEVGVFTGVTTLAMAQAIPEDGYILACDINAEWASIGHKYWQQADIDHKIDLVIAPALETLQQRIDQGEGNTYDFAFVDANKKPYPEYYELCLQLVRPGGIIILDNALVEGKVADPADEQSRTIVMRELLATIKTDDRVDTSLIPVADGMSLIRKR